jgi:hypothetical protein
MMKNRLIRLAGYSLAVAMSLAFISDVYGTYYMPGHQATFDMNSKKEADFEMAFFTALIIVVLACFVYELVDFARLIAEKVCEVMQHGTRKPVSIQRRV